MKITSYREMSDYYRLSAFYQTHHITETPILSQVVFTPPFHNPLGFSFLWVPLSSYRK